MHASINVMNSEVCTHGKLHTMYLGGGSCNDTTSIDTVSKRVRGVDGDTLASTRIMARGIHGRILNACAYPMVDLKFWQNDKFCGTKYGKHKCTSVTHGIIDYDGTAFSVAKIKKHHYLQGLNVLCSRCVSGYDYIYADLAFHDLPLKYLQINQAKSLENMRSHCRNVRVRLQSFEDVVKTGAWLELHNELRNGGWLIWEHASFTPGDVFVTIGEFEEDTSLDSIFLKAQPFAPNVVPPAKPPPPTIHQPVVRNLVPPARPPPPTFQAPIVPPRPSLFQAPIIPPRPVLPAYDGQLMPSMHAFTPPPVAPTPTVGLYPTVIDVQSKDDAELKHVEEDGKHSIDDASSAAVDLNVPIFENRTGPFGSLPTTIL